MKYVIWGAGERGARLFPHLKKEEVVAFIDNNLEKVGKEYLGKKIISFEEYKHEYKDCWIIISIMYENIIEDILLNSNIAHYFLLSDCPGEYQTPNITDHLESYVHGYIEADKVYGIYGYTLYSLQVYEWVKNKTGKEPIIIPQKGLLQKRIGLNKMYSKVINIKGFEDISEDEVDEVLIAVEDLEHVNSCKKKKWLTKNVYDCSRDIEQYYNATIEKYKNIHQGKRCFIVATGPSLQFGDLDKLHTNKELCISMNHIWKAFEKTEWKPDYYVADDWRTLIESAEMIENEKGFKMFLGDTNKEFWKHKYGENIIKHHFCYEYSETRTPKFSEDFSRQCYMGSTVTYSCLQLAAYMGFSKIYLLGVDFSYASAENSDKYTHFFEEKELKSTGYTKQVTLAYQAAKEYADSHGIKIYNATRGGKLEVFERVDFDSLFE